MSVKAPSDYGKYAKSIKNTDKGPLLKTNVQIHEWKQALLAPPLPLILLNNSRLCSTLHVLVKTQPSTRSTGPRSPTRLGIQSQDLALPNEYSLGHRGLSAASGHKLAFTRRHHTLFTATDTTALYKIPFLFFFFFFLSQSKLIFKVPTTT